jgi:hypothetical protein
MENKKQTKYNKSDVTLIIFFSVVCAFSIAIITFFLIKYPIPWETANGKGGLVVILGGFAVLTMTFLPHLRKPVIVPQQETDAGILTPSPRVGWKGIPIWKRVLIVISMLIMVPTLVLAFGAIILSLFASL